MRPKLPMKIKGFVEITALETVRKKGEAPRMEMQIKINKYHPWYFVYLSRKGIRYIWRLILQTIKGF